MKTALITGVVGQDGAYLSALLRSRGLRVIGTAPPVPQPAGFAEAYLQGVDVRVIDLADQPAMTELLDGERPDEIYNLASISSVAASWHAPVAVARVNGVAFLSLLEAVRSLRSTGYEPRICQASSAEIFGDPRYLGTDEAHPIAPNNPYAVAKAFAHFTAQAYRQAYGMFVSAVILFNHESPLRPATFVTRKITTAAVEIAAGRQDVLELGRRDIRRDWGAASDYVRAMAAALSHNRPDDFCIGSGVSHELGEFVAMAFAAAGIADPAPYVRTNPDFVRPHDIPETRANPAKAAAELGWRPEVSLEQVVADMVAVDRARVETGREHDPAYMEPGVALPAVLGREP